MLPSNPTTNFKWQKVAENELEFNNQFKFHFIQTITLFNKKICLLKNKHGVFAFDEKCPHNGASLSSGSCTDNNEIICPKHRYPFNLKTGMATSGLALCLQTYPIVIQNNGVFVGTKKKWWEA